MTFSTSNRDLSRVCRPPRRGGFTLTEMLVVIGIIVVLATLLVPTVIRTVRQGTKAAMAADLQAIATALEAYKQDHGDYPRVSKNAAWSNGDYFSATELAPNPPTGAQILCQALMGPAEATATSPSANSRPVQDGNNGFGFRVRPGGQVFGPYLRVGQFRIGDPENLDSGTPPTNPAPFKMCLLDRNDQPILYYPARPGPRNPALARTYIGNTVATPGPEDFTWDVGDNRFDKDRPPVYVSKGDFQAMVGDYDGSGAIEQGGTVPEQELANGPYILWGAGPDGSFGLTFPDNDLHPDRLKPEQAILNSKAAQTCDDVTNFRN